MNFKEVLDTKATDREVTFNLDFIKSALKYESPECNLIILENNLYVYDTNDTLLAIIK